MTTSPSTPPCVLLISPGVLAWTDTDFGLPHLVSLGGYLQHHLGVRVEIIDLSSEGGDHEQLRRTLTELGPYLLIGLSCYSSFDYLRVMALARFIKRLYPDVPLVGGGYHASAVPEDLSFDGSPFDAVVTGEGETALRVLVERRLGGGVIERGVHAGGVVEHLDELPPYRWELLARYWPRAHDLGRKLQIYLGRGCPYRCTFCMERAKSGHGWRAFSPERALDELRRLARVTPLGHWIVNIADPLFGLKREWRRHVLEGIAREGPVPRQFWTLTRSDDLDEEDVALLARARFSIGVGVESGSPEMLARMQKTANPTRYLAALERLAALSRKHGLSWAANIIVGHPGETLASMRETHDFVRRLFTTAGETCGWLSIDPFRLYPGSHVFANRAEYTARYGTRFHDTGWWRSWVGGPFRAEHVDPSAELDYAARVGFMYDHYPPLVAEIARRFRGQGRSVDRVFRRSLREQEHLMSERMRATLLGAAARARATPADRPDPAESAGAAIALPVPIGLQVRNAAVSRREHAVRRLLESGVLRTERLVEAFLQVAPEDYLDGPRAEALLADRPSPDARAGQAPASLGITTYAIGLEALAPAGGDAAIDLAARDGYMAALLAALVGPSGSVVALSPGSFATRRALARRLRPAAIDVRGGGASEAATMSRTFDLLWLGAAMPRFPDALRARMDPGGGRCVSFCGPRFRAQDMVCLSRHQDTVSERVLARVRAPLLAGPWGWLRRERATPRGGAPT